MSPTHSGAESLPSTKSVFSRSRPTMSRLIMAVLPSSQEGLLFTNAAEPSTPSSSPLKEATTTSRVNSLRAAESVVAISSKVAVPEPLSSAPRCGSLRSGVSELGPPMPR